MRRPARDPNAHERGFILVGVVTFMLALTILGLSLFALSSYEAQFFQSAAAREQSLQNCESGMEVVKALLNSKYPQVLENSQLAVGQFGVTSALAYQRRSALLSDTVSQGPVNWDSTVVIVVRASSGGAERTLEATFAPTALEDPYKRLIAAGDGIRYVSTYSTGPSAFQMSGKVWHQVQTSADTAWTRQVAWTFGRPLEPTDPPQVFADAFVDRKLGSSPDPAAKDWDDPYNYTMQFLNPASLPKYFRSPPKPTDQNSTDQTEEYGSYEFYSYPSVTITVRGTAVWVVDQGVCFRRVVRVKADQDAGSATLVIVAKPNGRHPGYENRGIWFQGGLDLETVDGVRPRVYLVSQGDIAVTHDHSRYEESRADRVSIVAGGDVELGGPDSEREFRLAYVSSMDALADRLRSEDALPPVGGGNGSAYTVGRVQWLETTPR